MVYAAALALAATVILPSPPDSYIYRTYFGILSWPGPFAAAILESWMVRDQPWLPQVVPRTSYGCHGRSPSHGTNDGRGGPIMAAIAGPVGQFVAAMVGPGPSWIAIIGPPGPTVGGTSLRVTSLVPRSFRGGPGTHCMCMRLIN